MPRVGPCNRTTPVATAFTTATQSREKTVPLRKLLDTDDAGRSQRHKTRKGVPGSTTFDGVVYEVKASGADIWGTADAFRLVRGQGLYSRELTARVRSVQNTHVWAKAGVMFRQSPESDRSQHVMVEVTPGEGVAMQYRPEYQAPSVEIAVRSGVAPESVRLTRVRGPRAVAPMAARHVRADASRRWPSRGLDPWPA